MKLAVDQITLIFRTQPQVASCYLVSGVSAIRVSLLFINELIRATTKLKEGCRDCRIRNNGQYQQYWNQQ